MNIFQTLMSRKDDKTQRDYLPEVNSFVDVAVGGRTELRPIESIGATDFTIRAASKSAVGTEALFNYSNAVGRFRFRAKCLAVDGGAATYALPNAITVIEKFDEKRRGVRLKHVLPITWRYAPGGSGYGQFVGSTAVDISSLGLAFLVPRSLKVGTQIEVAISLPGSPSFEVVGTVSRPTEFVSEGKYLAGISFDLIGPTESNAIASFIVKRHGSFRKRSFAATS